MYLPQGLDNVSIKHIAMVIRHKIYIYSIL